MQESRIIKVEIFYNLCYNKIDIFPERDDIMDYKYIFGPVPSRRLGSSLGIDLIPYKTCSLNCVYCECGKTTDLTFERKEYVPTERVIEELDDYLKTEPELDYITFSGSGEPTLHNGIGEIIKFLKENYPQYQLALLTNSTLLNDEKLQDEIKKLDLIVPSLDAVSEDVFQKINRPVEGLSAQKIVQGLINLNNFLQEMSGWKYLLYQKLMITVLKSRNSRKLLIRLIPIKFRSIHLTDPVLKIGLKLLRIRN